MNYWILPLSTTLSVTIDRLEGDFAILEWQNEALTAIEHQYLPFQVQEGCRIQLSLYPSPTGSFHVGYKNPVFLKRLGKSLLIPIDNILHPGMSYWILFEKHTCGDWR